MKKLFEESARENRKSFNLFDRLFFVSSALIIAALIIQTMNGKLTHFETLGWVLALAWLFISSGWRGIAKANAKDIVALGEEIEVLLGQDAREEKEKQILGSSSCSEEEK